MSDKYDEYADPPTPEPEVVREVVAIALKFAKPTPRPKKARKPMRRSWMRKKAPRRLSRAGSDPAYLAFVRTLPCVIGSVRCRGPIHAHHAGRKPGVAMKADDSTAVPLCMVHHHDWHAGTGPFFTLTKMERFAWSLRVIAETRSKYTPVSS